MRRTGTFASNASAAASPRGGDPGRGSPPKASSVDAIAEVVLFHHALGRTESFLSLAEHLRGGGHVVHVPDLYDGATFTRLADGIAHAERIGFRTVVERGARSVEDLPAALVYVGLSLGVLPAQMLAQTRPGARGAVLVHAAVPPDEFGEAWPPAVPVQIHTMEDDELGDVDVARQFMETVDVAEVFLYPGGNHLFAEAGFPDHDPSSAALLNERVLAFLDRLG